MYTNVEFTMATIQKFKRSKGIVYRVLIRKADTKPISRTFSTKRLAVQFAQRVESDREFLIAYGYENKKDIKLSWLITDYLDNSYKGKSKQEQTRKLVLWLKSLGDIPIKDIKVNDIASSLDALPHHLSPATINRHKAAISGVLTYACSKSYINTNPARLVPYLAENNNRTRFLSPHERTCLFKVCKASDWDKLYLIVLMAITTGARKGELSNLKWMDIDFERQTAYVQTTKNGLPKALPLTDSVIQELQLFRRDKGLIFPSPIKPNKPLDFTKHWRQALEKAEIEDFVFHSLRHTCASYLAMNGASLLEIADVLGHKQIQVTKRYAHLCIDHKQRLINKVMGGI